MEDEEVLGLTSFLSGTVDNFFCFFLFCFVLDEIGGEQLALGLMHKSSHF